jgi:hypothetical protein
VYESHNEKNVRVPFLYVLYSTKLESVQPKPFSFLFSISAKFPTKLVSEPERQHDFQQQQFPISYSPPYQTKL